MREPPLRKEPTLGDRPEGLEAEIRALRRELATLNRHRFIRVQNSLPRLVLFQFLRGLALGLGTVVGASVLVSVIAFFLAQIDFIPIVGDWAGEIARQIEDELGGRRGDGDPSPAAMPDGSIEPAPTDGN